ncbi:putative methyltransferase [Labilithrix luteola]|uniref:Putative methyltransferase n=1 Tax=Labilithrix luteola TaxID=1391654 RepID=A0A0K1QCD0_9BACT|nr:class I SAM-dependent methyltransferase [Labilithrix luteola]AKV03090.1 putative methyltransferase [Labilithrix luteola]
MERDTSSAGSNGNAHGTNGMRDAQGSRDARPMRDDARSTDNKGFNYDGIPKGYYDTVLRQGNPIRRLWHVSKFERVLDYLPERPNQSILDIGCFAGTFLSLIPEHRFARQVGVDILPEQVAYANAQYGTPFREFRHVVSIGELSSIDEQFDCITLIEVIEHLRPDEIRALFSGIVQRLKPGGKLVLTTPNYASAWPAIEVVLNRMSDVSYEEQHITKFTFFNFERKLASIYPDLFLYFNTVDFKTTTHFVTPFLAGFSFDVARGLSRVVPHQKWRHPFGNLALMVLTRGPAQSEP